MAEQKTPTKWVSYGKFTGLQTLFDPSKIDDGAAPAGQNTSIIEGDRISSRPYGYELLGEDQGTPDDFGGYGAVSSLHTFHKRSGEQVLMRGLDTRDFGSLLQFYDDKYTNQWQFLYGDGNLVLSPFGFTDFNVNADQNSFVYFSNVSLPLSRWNGAFSSFVSATNSAGFIGTVAEIPTGVGNVGADEGYQVGDLFEINGGSPDATGVVTATANGGIKTYTISNAGAGYNVGDLLLFVDPSLPNSGVLNITTVDGGGAITAVTITDGGTNYSAGVVYPLTGSTGSGASVQVTSVDPGGIITAVTIVDGGASYTAGNTINVSSVQNGIFSVATVGGSGEVTSVTLEGRGIGYIAGVTYQDFSGIGSPAAEMTIDSIQDGYVTDYEVSLNNPGYTTGVKTTTTISGAGSGLTVDITSLAQNTITISTNQEAGLAATVGDTFQFPAGTLLIGDPSDPFNPGAVTAYTYTGILGDTFTGVQPDPTLVAHAVGSTVYQAIQSTGSGVSGNILLSADNRIFVSGDTANPQVVYFSEYGNPLNIGDTTLVTSDTATAPGIFNLTEGGGGVSAMVLQEGSIYIFKKAIVYQAQLTDSFYTLQPLKPYDGNTQSMGAFKGTVFTGSNRVFLATPDNQILALERVQFIDYPQASAISYSIKPTIDALDLLRMKGIVFNNKAFMSMSTIGGRSTNAIFSREGTIDGLNDRVFVWNTLTQKFDTPIVGWNVACWAIYDDRTGNGNQLYFGSDVDPNVYRVTSTPTDGDFPVTASWPSKRYDFGNPTQQKWCNNFFVYGRILPSTTLTVRVLFNEDGSTQTYTGSFSGTDTAKLFGTTDDNSFGENPFGVQVFGDQADTTGMRYFRVYFVNKVRAVPFYNIQIAFSSEGINQQWEVLDYAFDVGAYQQPENRNLYSDFSASNT